MSINQADLKREFGNDRLAIARAFLKRSKINIAKRDAEMEAVRSAYPVPPLKCYTLTANDGHRYVTCDDKNKKKKKKLSKKKLKNKRLVIVDKPVNKIVPFQPDFERELKLDPMSKRDADMKAARSAVAKAQALRYGGY